MATKNSNTENVLEALNRMSDKIEESRSRRLDDSERDELVDAIDTIKEGLLVAKGDIKNSDDRITHVDEKLVGISDRIKGIEDRIVTMEKLNKEGMNSRYALIQAIVLAVVAGVVGYLFR